jgi:hypothetical protein
LAAATPLGMFFIPLISELIRQAGQQKTAKSALAWIHLSEAVLGKEVKKETLDQVLSIGWLAALCPDEGVERGTIFCAQTLQGLRCSRCLLPRCNEDFSPLGFVKARLRCAPRYRGLARHSSQNIDANEGPFGGQCKGQVHDKFMAWKQDVEALGDSGASAVRLAGGIVGAG